MNSKKAHDQLKKINADRNKIGVGGYRNSRREKCKEYKKLNEALGEVGKERDARILEADND